MAMDNLDALPSELILTADRPAPEEHEAKNDDLQFEFGSVVEHTL